METFQRLNPCTKSIIFFEVELRDTLHCGTELPDLFQGVDVCPLVKVGAPCNPLKRPRHL